MALQIYRRLRRRFGPRHWWPGDSPLEVIVGAILTQNTAWQNVTKAISNLKDASVLGIPELASIPEARLAQLIRPSGYFNQKARKLKGFVAWLMERHQGDLGSMFRTPLPRLRKELLALHGIGPETADSILLYAAGMKIFVVDAYTRRVFSRHGLIQEQASYDEIQAWFEARLPRSLPLYNDYHAQIVQVGKEYCRKTPLCRGCPLELLAGFPPRPHDGGRGAKK